MHDGIVIEADLPCAKCGYNLRTLPVRGDCPECGLAVREGLAAFKALPIPEATRRTLRTGAVLLAVAVAIVWISGVLWIAVFQDRALAWGGSRAWAAGSIVVQCLKMLSLGLAVGWAAGRPWLRQTSWAMAAVFLVGQVVYGVLWLAGSATTFAYVLWRPLDVVPVVLLAMGLECVCRHARVLGFGGLKWVAGVGLVAGMVGVVGEAGYTALQVAAHFSPSPFSGDWREVVNGRPGPRAPLWESARYMFALGGGLAWLLLAVTAPWLAMRLGRRRFTQ
jgi:hypothetical protein